MIIVPLDEDSHGIIPLCENDYPGRGIAVTPGKTGDQWLLGRMKRCGSIDFSIALQVAHFAMLYHILPLSQKHQLRELNQRGLPEKTMYHRIRLSKKAYRYDWQYAEKQPETSNWTISLCENDTPQIEQYPSVRTICPGEGCREHPKKQKCRCGNVSVAAFFVAV